MDIMGLLSNSSNSVIINIKHFKPLVVYGIVYYIIICLHFNVDIDNSINYPTAILRFVKTIIISTFDLHHHDKLQQL